MFAPLPKPARITIIEAPPADERLGEPMLRTPLTKPARAGPIQMKVPEEPVVDVKPHSRTDEWLRSGSSLRAQDAAPELLRLDSPWTGPVDIRDVAYVVTRPIPVRAASSQCGRFCVMKHSLLKKNRADAARVCNMEPVAPRTRAASDEHVETEIREPITPQYVRRILRIPLTFLSRGRGSRGTQTVPAAGSCR